MPTKACPTIDTCLRQPFREYQGQIRRNADVLADTLHEGRLDVLTGGTDTHLLQLDLRSTDWTGKEAEERLKGLPAEERLKGLPAEELRKHLPAEERVKDLSVDDLVRALPPETLKALVQHVQANGSPPKSP